MKETKFILGAHTLSAAFTINSQSQLEKIMEIAVANGATLLEIPYLLCEVPWRLVGYAAIRTGIKEIALCHFWPRTKKNGAPVGDPLGRPREMALALDTIEGITDAADYIREAGIKVRFIDGSSHVCLGWDHLRSSNWEIIENRMVSFLQDAGDICRKNDLILAVEFLRESEDTVVSTTEGMIEILDKVDHPAVKMHLDVFHADETDSPEDAILHAATHIAYLHLHGSERRVPGSKADTFDWPKIIEAVNQIDSGVKRIPVVSEPFGDETRRENKALGKGLPRTPDLDKYLPLAYGVFRQNGLRIAK